MDYDVSSKKEQRGVLAGMLLGTGKKAGENFYIQHRQATADYLLFKKMLLEQITRKPVGWREKETARGDRLLSIEPKLTPLVRVLVKKLYSSDRLVLTRQFLNFLTPQGLAIWFMDKGSKSFKKRSGRVRALEIFLNTNLSREANEIAIAYFSQVWGYQWGLSRNRDLYRLRMGTRVGKEFLSFLAPYIHPQMLYKVQTSYNTTAAT